MQKIIFTVWKRKCQKRFSAKQLFFLKDDRTIAADIVFLVDVSWSIGQENFQYVREFLFRVIKAFAIGENRFRFGLVQYTETPRSEFHLNTYFAKQDILFHIWNMSYKGGGTKTGLALDYLIKEQLTKANGSRAEQGVPQIIIVLTDGQSQDDVIPASASLKSANVIMFAIGVQRAVEWELMEIASAPYERSVYRLHDFAALEGIVNDLVTSVHMAAAQLLSDGIIKDTTGKELAGNTAPLLTLLKLMCFKMGRWGKAHVHPP